MNDRQNQLRSDLEYIESVSSHDGWIICDWVRLHVQVKIAVCAGESRRVLMLDSVEITGVKGKGCFTYEVLPVFMQVAKNTNRTLYVQSVYETRFQKFFDKLGFYPADPPPLPPLPINYFMSL